VCEIRPRTDAGSQTARIVHRRRHTDPLPAGWSNGTVPARINCCPTPHRAHRNGTLRASPRQSRRAASIRNFKPRKSAPKQGAMLLVEDADFVKEGSDSRVSAVFFKLGKGYA
jgi:hypothetical protein